MIRQTLLALALSFTFNAAAQTAQDIIAAPANAERACLLDANPSLFREIFPALDGQLRKIKPVELRAIGLFLEERARAMNDLLLTAKSLGVIGTSYFNERNYAAGEPYDLEALELARIAQDDETIANQLLAVAIYDTVGGRPLDAVDRLTEALTRTKKPRTAALIHNSLAISQRTAGNLAQSLAELRHARDEFVKLGDDEAVAGVTNNIGNTALQFGDYDLAEESFEKALAIAERAKNDRVRSFALNNLGSIALQRGNVEKAELWSQQALELKQKIGEQAAVATGYINLGEIASRRNRPRESFAAFMHARAIAQTLGDRAQVALAEAGAASMAAHSNTPHVALYFADRSLDIARGKLPAVVVTAAVARGNALRALGRNDEARAAFAEGIDAVEAQRKQAGGSNQQRAQFLEARLNPFLGMVGLLAATKPAEALQYAEQAKARVLLDLIKTDDATTGRFARIAPDSAAIEFVVGARRTYAFIATTNGVRPRGIAITDAELTREVRALRQRLADRDLGFDAASSKLFTRLLGKVWPLVREKKSLVIIPDGALWELPFQALRADDGRYLAEHTSIAYAPSLTALAAMRTTATRTSDRAIPLLAFGNPPSANLPEATRQLDAIARLYGDRSRVYTGEAATERRLRDEIASARVVQIATHGVLNGDNPLYSHLLFARAGNDDGRLEARELARLTLKNDLVVLSACDTARGTTRGGEGVIGMAWALFVAGCPSTVVSQWSVDAASTAEVMIRFHRHLRAGSTKSAALRNASAELMRDPRYRHPFYWAPFIVIGDDSPLR